jgi:hypothetical protein
VREDQLISSDGEREVGAPSERVVAQFHHGMAVMLSMVVTDESRARVTKRLRAAERVLQALGPLGS